MATPKQQYAKILADIAGRYKQLDEETIKRLITLLQETRKNIGQALLGNPTDFETFRLGQLRASVEQLMAQFQSEFNASLRASFADAASLGGASVSEPLQAIGIRGAFNVLPPQQVNVALDFSAMLVKNISDDLRNTIDNQLRLATLAQKTPFQAMKDITSALGIKAQDGVWGLRKRPEVVRGVAARAETIVRTEMTRIFNLAHHSQQQQAAQAVSGLLKRWIATGDARTRPSHLAAHRYYANNPIPIAQPFEVGGALLMYPGDPSAPAAETVNCRCTQAMIVPEVSMIGTPLDTQVEKETQKRKNAAAT